WETRPAALPGPAAEDGTQTIRFPAAQRTSSTPKESWPHHRSGEHGRIPPKTPELALAQASDEPRSAPSGESVLYSQIGFLVWSDAHSRRPAAARHQGTTQTT